VGKKPVPFLLLSHNQIFQVYWLLEGFLFRFKARRVAIGLYWREERSRKMSLLMAGGLEPDDL